jgi:hypothetical protein
MASFRARTHAALCALTLLSVASHVREGRAQAPARAKLHYESSEHTRCPDEQAFRDVVAGRLGYDPFAADAERTIHARIEGNGNSLVGTTRVLDQRGELLGTSDVEASAQDCNELVTAMAIAVSIVLDPMGAAAVSEQEPEPRTAEPSESTPPPLPPQQPAEVSPAFEHTRKLALITRASLAVDGGLLPGLTIGPVLSLGVGLEHLSVLVDGRVDLMPHAATTGSGDRLEAALYSAGPALCVSFGLGIACGNLELGAFQGRGVNVTDPRTQTSFFAALGARAGLRVPLGKTLSFQALGELRAPLVRTSLSIEHSTVWNAPPIGFGGMVGLGATFL